MHAKKQSDKYLHNLFFAPKYLGQMQEIRNEQIQRLGINILLVIFPTYRTIDL